MNLTAKLPHRADPIAKDRPPLSPLAKAWAEHPDRVADAIEDAADSEHVEAAIKYELKRCAAGEQTPDCPGLRGVWSMLGLAGLGDLLREQRCWHREHGGRRGGGR